jgi:hypothetical protein
MRGEVWLGQGQLYLLPRVYKAILNNVRSGVVTAVVLKIQVIWDVVLCCWERGLMLGPEGEGCMIIQSVWNYFSINSVLSHKS